MRKRFAWSINLLNIGVLTFLVAKGYNPIYGAIACTVAVVTILISTIPEALTPGIIYNDENE